MARLLLVDVFDNQVKEVECNELDNYYKHLRCNCFDIAYRKVGGRYFDIFVDDIGLFAEHPIVSAMDSAGNPMLVGNLIFANHDAEGNTTSLSDEDISIIKEHLMNVVDFDAEPIRQYRAVFPCDY